MDQNHGSSSPYNYPNPYYPQNPHPNQYGHDPYANPPQQYPYNPSPHSFNYPYPPPPQPCFTTPHSGPINYHYPPPPPPPSSAPNTASFDFNRPPPSSDFFGPQPPHPYPYPYQALPESHGHPQPQPQPPFSEYGSSSPYNYQQNEAYSQSGHYSHAHSGFAGPYQQENMSSVGYSNPSQGSAYPPLHDLMSNVRLSDNNQPTAPASPPAPAAHPLLHSNSVTKEEKPWGHSNSVPTEERNHDYPLQHSNSVTKEEKPWGHSNSVPTEERNHDFYGYSNSSFSGWGSSPHSDPGNSPNLSDYSGSFNDSVHSQSLQIVPIQNNVASLRVLLLHGNLDIWVHGAKNLPNMDMFHKTLGEMFGRKPANSSTKVEGTVSHKITSDPYVTVSISNAVIGRTFVISNNENPVWEQHFYVNVAHYAAELHFVVKDSDVVGSQIIGVVAIPVEQIYSGERVEGTYPILNNNGKPCKPGAVLSLSIQYIPMEKLIIYHQGVGAGPEYIGVPGTYFPLRKGGTVTLYQDAHVPDGCLPDVMLDNGMHYVHGKCWVDIFDAIQEARRLIYITGWSVWHRVRLLRDTRNASDSTLGELLRIRSQEGVRVLLLVWDDPTSRSILGYRTDGVMATHDEETRRFFKHSSVQVLLCPRVAAKRHSWVKQQEVGTIYTHHQKTVIVDADAGNNKRKIVAFVGGLDLCDGRYDTPHHPLFRTLQTLHTDDYHNPTFTGNVGGCPREPWHDLHSKVDGPAAYDVLTNFEERWLKASKLQGGIKKLKSSFDDALLRIERIPDILKVFDAPSVGDDNPEAWHGQIFRSIDSGSVKGFPKDPKDASIKNLACGKNVLIDMSIHTAYVKAIRAAQHYIYIENQYFIGSSFNWSQHKDLGANNLIPMEIALKIAEKIRANERFAVYIVIPMWPEGVPTGAATQRILFWQNKTMQMMYETVYKALVEVGLEAAYSPQDYLNFFCLGNREAIDIYENIAVSGNPPPANSPQATSRNNRRFMIYVHSKGMIVDDEYVILGSANINQRSMEGTRDTEIAMGTYQPHHTWARKQSYPHGQIHGFRMSLWAEHTGTIEECFLQPESLECVRRVRTMAELNWKQFSANEITEMRGHLLKYPVEVDRKGKVKPLPGHEEFPDVGGRIVGSFIAIQENLTI
ncbi:PREDICTED: phospholipase D gamma 1-like isoform X3 [Lupinus angustifolius]|uniref:phospholipase D gamma 1-like isoform X3 n=1 Tax=Lupinus angustifolius TaxID=3871 RepID=UPI00092F7F11|nr:PREDICTED: phospholipase D gamma 1-like isoform X3 [Lupinus angustifolius]